VPELMHCIYASSARRHFETAELTALLQAARKHNDAAGLTGMLLYTEGSFFQVLEGVPDAVEALYARIELDKRHDQVTKIIAEATPSRSFANWTMGFSQVSRKELALISGTNDFFCGSSCFIGLDSGRAKKLLSAFREGRWRTTLSGAQTAAV
jgi:Sensors of blue-light using FAD